MNTGPVSFYENILRKCQEKLTKEQQDFQNKEESQNMEFNISTFTINRLMNGRNPNLLLDSHMEDSNLSVNSNMDIRNQTYRNIFLSTENLYLHDNMYNEEISYYCTYITIINRAYIKARNYISITSYLVALD